MNSVTRQKHCYRQKFRLQWDNCHSPQWQAPYLLNFQWNLYKQTQILINQESFYKGKPITLLIHIFSLQHTQHKNHQIESIFVWKVKMLVTQAYPTLCNLKNCSPQAPLSLGFSRQNLEWGLPFLSPGDLPTEWIKVESPTLQADFLPSEPPGKNINAIDL